MISKLPLAQCDNCILKNHQVLPGQFQGNETLVVGESPDLDEVETGQPFIGRKGRELYQALAGRKADLTFAVPCFPGAQKDALRLIRLKASKQGLGDPISCCRPRLLAEVSRYGQVILLGKVALEAITRSRASILDKRGFAFSQEIKP